MPNILTTFFDFISRLGKTSTLSASTTLDDPIDLYEALEKLYGNDDSITMGDTTRRLRTCVNRSVEFFVAKLLPGDKIGITAKNTKVQEAIETVHKTSNFQGQKPAMLRDFALYGDSFVRVRGDVDKVLLENVKPLYVTDFTEDSRGFLTSLRIDIPTMDANGNSTTYTEYWNLTGLWIWEGYHTRATELEFLGAPKSVTSLSELGVDFIPVVHTKFKDTGYLRGQSCVYHALDKIYEANRLATRLNDLQFRHNKPIWASLANGMDKEGRPLPPPKIKTSGGNANASTAEQEKEFIFGDVVSMPGTSDIKALVPGIDFANALAILKDQVEEIEKDLPELRYYSLRETELSGRAIEQLLAGAIDRANEARNNFLASMKRMHEMALTIGQFLGIFPSALGTFDSGSFDHDITVDEAFGSTLDERAATLKTLKEGGVPVGLAMKKVGFSVEEITDAKTELGRTPTPEPFAP